MELLTLELQDAGLNTKGTAKGISEKPRQFLCLIASVLIFSSAMAWAQAIRIESAPGAGAIPAPVLLPAPSPPPVSPPAASVSRVLPS